SCRTFRMEFAIMPGSGILGGNNAAEPGTASVCRAAPILISLFTGSSSGPLSGAGRALTGHRPGVPGATGNLASLGQAGAVGPYSRATRKQLHDRGTRSDQALRPQGGR